MNKLLALVAAALMMATSCQSRHNESSQYQFIDSDGWAYGDTLTFSPELSTPIADGCLTLSLRHTNEYIYSNLWLEVTTTDSLATRVDTINVVLADELGRWQGRGIGTDFQNTDTLFSRIRLRRPVTIKVRHIMRVDRLTDIEQVGIAFKE
jgi:gliding motility-associated lipoprotein GldH